MQELLDRIHVDPHACGGMPVIRGTRVMVSILLDGLAEGLAPEEIVRHYPHLTVNDVRAAAAYGSVLTKEKIWKIAG